MNSSLPAQAIAADVCVAPQLNAEAMAEAARLGFKSVVNNRPDFEGGPHQRRHRRRCAGRRAGIPVPARGGRLSIP